MSLKAIPSVHTSERGALCSCPGNVREGKTCERCWGEHLLHCCTVENGS